MVSRPRKAATLPPKTPKPSPVPVGKFPGEPRHHLRQRALLLGHHYGWFKHLHPIDPDKIAPTDLAFLVEVDGRRLHLAADDVLPFVYGMAVVHGRTPEAAYRAGLFAGELFHPAPNSRALVFSVAAGSVVTRTVLPKRVHADAPGAVSYAVQVDGKAPPVLVYGQEVAPMVYGMALAVDAAPARPAKRARTAAKAGA